MEMENVTASFDAIYFVFYSIIIVTQLKIKSFCI